MYILPMKKLRLENSLHNWRAEHHKQLQTTLQNRERSVYPWLRRTDHEMPHKYEIVNDMLKLHEEEFFVLKL